MRILPITTMLVALGAAVASADLVLEPVTGADGIEDYYDNDVFSPNQTRPELQISGSGSVENSGGVAVFDTTEFTLDIQFLSDYRNERKRDFDTLMLTAAFQPGGAAFDKIRVYDPADPSQFLDFHYDSFVDAELLGLPMPPENVIRGMGTGEADFLSLNGALLAGVDLGVGLERDQSATSPPTVSVGVQVFAPEPESKIRFDVFGLRRNSPWVVYGNNPNSGSGGVTTDGGSVVPEPATGSVVLAGAAALTWWRRRRQS